MIPQELLKYIKENLSSGFSEEEIKNALISAGWQVEIINTALNTFNEVGYKSSAPAVELLKDVEEPLLPLSHHEIPAQASKNQAPIKIQPISTTLVNMPTSTTHVSVFTIHHKILIAVSILSILVLLAIVGVTLYFYLNHLSPF